MTDTEPRPETRLLAARELLLGVLRGKTVPEPEQEAHLHEAVRHIERCQMLEREGPNSHD